MNYEIRRVDARTYDVFTGNQWSSHSRIRQGRSSTFVTAGEKLPYAFLKLLHGVLHPSMPINYQQNHHATLSHCFNVL